MNNQSTMQAGMPRSGFTRHSLHSTAETMIVQWCKRAEVRRANEAIDTAIRMKRRAKEGGEVQQFIGESVSVSVSACVSETSEDEYTSISLGSMPRSRVM